MISERDLSSLIHRGGVFFDVPGTTAEEVFRNAVEKISFPEGFDRDTVYQALCRREKIMSTAVGNGVALPHSQTPLITRKEDEMICVCYLKTPIDMQAPDSRKVFVLFILLTSETQSHLQILSALATMLSRFEFRKLLENHADENELLMYSGIRNASEEL